MGQMKAAVLTGHGGPEVLELRSDWPRPQPSTGEVLVRVVAAAVNNTDIWTREGSYGWAGDPGALAGWRGPISFPRVQGGDIAGVIVDVGPGVDSGRIDQRVLVAPALYRVQDGDLVCLDTDMIGPSAITRTSPGHSSPVRSVARVTSARSTRWRSSNWTTMQRCCATD